MTYLNGVSSYTMNTVITQKMSFTASFKMKFILLAACVLGMAVCAPVRKTSSISKIFLFLIPVTYFSTACCIIVGKKSYLKVHVAVFELSIISHELCQEFAVLFW